MLSISGVTRASALLASVLASALLVSPAQAKLGRELATIIPSPSGNGRAIELRPHTSTGYFTFEGSQNTVYELNLRTHRSVGRLTTNLQAVCGCSPSDDFGFGALGWRSPAVLWGSEYGLGNGWIDRINSQTGQVQRAFNAKRMDRQAKDIDGLGVDADGTLWVSGDEAFTVDHFSPEGHKLSSFKLPFANSGIAVEGNRLWLVDYPDDLVLAYTKRGHPIRGESFSVANDLAHPEDLAIDTCTFRGKKAIWVFDAGTGGLMAAYQIGSSHNRGCDRP